MFRRMMGPLVIEHKVILPKSADVKHPYLSAGNAAEGIVGVFAIGCGVYSILSLGMTASLLMSLAFAISTTILALWSAWALFH